MSDGHQGDTRVLIVPADGTAAASVAPNPIVMTTSEDTGSTLILSGMMRSFVAGLRDEVQLLASDIAGIHHTTQDYDLEQRAQVKGRSGVPALLSELAIDRGMSWSNIARLIGVTVPAVRKWRQGGTVGGENRLALARLAAFMDLLEDFCVHDPTGWLEMPLHRGYTVTALDLYRDGKESHLLDFAADRLTVEQLLEKYNPEWRSAYRTDFEVFEAADGRPAIRKRT